MLCIYSHRMKGFLGLPSRYLRISSGGAYIRLLALRAWLALMNETHVRRMAVRGRFWSGMAVPDRFFAGGGRRKKK